METPGKTPLLKKLGIKPGHTVAFLNAPEDYFFESLVGLPEDLDVRELPEFGKMDFVQYFSESREEFERDFQSLKASLKKSGMLWVCWPKKASGIKSDLNGNEIRSICLPGGLVDAKVCSVDATWSGLKLVYRLKDR